MHWLALVSTHHSLIISCYNDTCSPRMYLPPNINSGTQQQVYKWVWVTHTCKRAICECSHVTCLYTMLHTRVWKCWLYCLCNKVETTSEFASGVNPCVCITLKIKYLLLPYANTVTWISAQHSSKKDRLPPQAVEFDYYCLLATVHMYSTRYIYAHPYSQKACFNYMTHSP